MREEKVSRFIADTKKYWNYTVYSAKSQLMKSLISQRNRTVVIVSHNLGTLEELCDRVMWMHEGKIMQIGQPKEVLKAYREFMK